jgi:hypothetical protein
MGFRRWALGMALCLLAAHRLDATEGLSGPLVSVSTFTVETSTAVEASTTAVPAPAASTSTWRTVPNTVFASGEDFQYVIKWGVVVAGYSNLTVPDIQKVGDRLAYHLVSNAHSAGVVNAFYKVHDINETWIDTQALCTLRYEKSIQEGKYRVEETTLLDQVRHRWSTRAFRFDNNSFEQKSGDIPVDALDALGSLYYVRTLPLEVGKSYSLDVHSGDKVYPLVVFVRKREKVRVPAGKFDCFRVEPILRAAGIFISKGKKLEVWITADELRVPVRMRSEVFIGHVSAELTEYNLGAPSGTP